MNARAHARALCCFATAWGAVACRAPLPPLEVHLGEVAPAAADEALATRDVEVDGAREVSVFVDGAARVVEIAVTFAAPGDLAVTIDGEAVAAAPSATSAGDVVAWWRPRPVGAAAEPVAIALEGAGSARVDVWTRGAPAPAARRERSLTWTDPALLDDPGAVGLGRVMAAASADGHGGRLLDAWFRRFATTTHSERAAPAQFMDEVAAAYGPDPTAWDLDALPFVVTGVHDRIDLGPRDGGCGQLRVSLASVHPVYAPLHLIFLFRMPASPEDDVAPDGTVHCSGTARRWARLSDLDGAAWTAAARAWLDAALVPELFLLAESVELTVSPWEWRQWWLLKNADPTTAAILPLAFDNLPLFQTVDAEAVNAPGPLRDAFLAFVEENAAALDARMLELPEEYSAPSARVPPSAPRTPLDLTGLDPAIAAAYPDLARNVEIVGCPVCHTENAEFVQTAADRTFSPFYDLELEARAARLDAMNAGEAVPLPPFGPLQE